MTGSIAPRPSRRGLGTLLAVVVLFFIVAFAVGLARHSHSTQVRGTAQTAAIGSLAVEIARSAVEEASQELARRLNTPSDPLFAAFRKEEGGRPRVENVILVPHSKGQLKVDPLLGGFEIEGAGVQADLVAHRPLATPLVKYETTGKFRLAATVRHRSTGVRRQYTTERSFKIALLSTPRPYDQFSVCVLHPESLYDSATKINQKMDDVVVEMRRVIEHRPLYIQTLRELIPKANERLKKAEEAGIQAGVTGQRIEYFEDQEFIAPLEGANLVQPPRISTEVTDRIHYLSINLVIGTRADAIPDLSYLYLSPRRAAYEEKRLDPALKEYEQARLDFLAISKEGQALIQKSYSINSKSQAQQYVDQSNALHARLLANVQRVRSSLENLSRTLQGFIDMVVEYTDFLIESADKMADKLRSYTYKFDTEEWRAKATYMFEGKDAVSRFQKMLIGYGNAKRPLNGIVFLDNLEEPLRFNKVAMSGKLVVVATGDVRLSDVSLSKDDNDLFTLQCEGTLTASGRVSGSLIPHGRFVASPDLVLTGNLIFDTVRNPEDLKGKLWNPYVRESDQGRYGRYYSGITGRAAPEYLYAAWAPWTTWTQIRRN